MDTLRAIHAIAIVEAGLSPAHIACIARNADGSAACPIAMNAHCSVVERAHGDFGTTKPWRVNDLSVIWQQIEQVIAPIGRAHSGK